MKPIYMAVDLNYYELPYAVADSAKELALMVGVKENNAVYEWQMGANALHDLTD